MIWLIIFPLALLGLIFLRFRNVSYYEGPTSDHFDGKQFYNPGIKKRGLIDVLQWKLTSKAIPWPKTKNVGVAIATKIPDSDDLRITFVNHSTILVQWRGKNFLTDPVWAERASPFKWIGPKRIHPPGINLENLPRIDVILLSHNHYDHLDLYTLKYLTATHSSKIITGLGNGKILEKGGIGNAVELDWWEQIDLGNACKVMYTPAQHFSSRGILDRDKALWGGFVISMGKEYIYYSGDTGYCTVFKHIKDRLGIPRLSILPIGAYEPRWFMESVHMSPQQAIRAHLDLESPVSMAIHFGTFHLSDEGIDDPTTEIDLEMKTQGLDPNTFWILRPGEIRQVP